MRLLRGVLLVPLLLLLACDSDDESRETLGTSGSMSATETTAGPEFPWPPVACGDVTCEQDEICVQPGQTCVAEPTPHFETPPPHCAAVPASCADEPEAELPHCLGHQVCMADEVSVELVSFMDGRLNCQPELTCV